MRPFLRAMCLALVLATPAAAGFTIRLEKKDLEADHPNQMVHMFLRSDFEAEVRSVTFAAFIGSSENAVSYGVLAPADYFDPEGNFQFNAGENGIQVKSPSSEYFWDLATSSPVAYTAGWAHNTSQVTVRFDTPRGSPDYVTLAANTDVKIGTLHLDTRNMSSQTLKLSFYDPRNELEHITNDGTLRFATTAVSTTAGDYLISDPTQLRILDTDVAVPPDPFSTSVTFNITSTPEPSVIGMLGLSLAGGAGWLRARARRRKSAP